jgi:hypothetical protein
MGNYTDAVYSRAEKIQQDTHAHIEALRATKRGKKLSYDSIHDTYMYLRIAVLELEIENIKDLLKSKRS